MFVLANWLLCILTSLIFLFIFAKKRFLIIKPSIVFLLSFHLRIQWGGTLQADLIESYLPEPYYFMLLLNVFPLLALGLSYFTWRRSTKHTWARLVVEGIQIDHTVLIVLFSCAVFITLCYLSYVPPRQTGLYILFTDPFRSAQVRADSLKLIDNAPLRYMFSFFRASFAPFLAVISAQLLIVSVQRKKLIQGLNALGVLAFVLVAISLTGERAPAAYFLLVIILSRLLMRGFQIHILRLACGGVAILSIPAILTMYREAVPLSLSAYFEYLEWMFKRAFGVPIEVALWHVHYAQSYGLFGIAAIPKLAWFFGVKPVEAGNIIGLAYAHNPLASISASTTFIFSYFSYFGSASILVSLFALQFLDSVLLVYRFLSNRTLIPLIASIMLSTSTLVESDYTTVFITNGFFISICLAVFLDLLTRLRLTSYAASPLVTTQHAVKQTQSW